MMYRHWNFECRKQASLTMPAVPFFLSHAFSK